MAPDVTVSTQGGVLCIQQICFMTVNPRRMTAEIMHTHTYIYKYKFLQKPFGCMKVGMLLVLSSGLCGLSLLLFKLFESVFGSCLLSLKLAENM